MASSYTTLLGLVLPVQGELQGTWGDTVNNELTSLLDTAIAGTTTLNTDADVTLSTTTGAANQARQQIILWTANGTTTRNITAPAQSKSYIVINASAGTQSIVLRGVGPTTGVTVLKGEQAVVAWNGSDFVKVSTFGGSPSFTNVTVTGTTTLSGLTASTALALNASKEVVSVTNTGTGNNVLATSPTLTTPNLGTPSALTLTNATGLPLSTGVTGTLATTNGGTGLTSFTANGIVYASSTSALATSSALTWNGSTLATTGALTVNGNTTLGDASTDTVQVNGYMGVGGAGSSSFGLQVVSTALTGSNQYGLFVNPTATASATTSIRGISVTPATAAASFTAGLVTSFFANNATLGAGSTITNQHGLYIADQTQGTNNFGITSLVSSGTNKWNIYASGTANNAFAGNVRIGSTTAPTNALDVTGAMTVSGNTTLGDASTDTVQVNGYMGVGGALASDTGIRVTNSALTGTGPAGIVSNITSPATGTNTGYGVYSRVNTAAASFTQSNNASFWAANPTVGAGSTISSLQGLYIEDLTGGTNNYGVRSLVSSGTNKWNIYASGTAANYFAGRVFAGTTTSRNSYFGAVDIAPIVQVEGSTAIASSLSLTRTADASPRLFLNNAATVISSSGLGQIVFSGGDGTQLRNGASILAEVDGTPGSGDMPGRLIFSTTADNASSVTERMRITSAGNVGIGTSSPSAPLHVVGGSASGTSYDVAVVTAGSSNTTGSGAKLYLSGTPTSPTTRAAMIEGVITGATNAHSMLFYTSASGASPTERLRIDSSGNLGLGVTPSAWRSTEKAIQITASGVSLYADSAERAVLATNTFVNSSGNAVYLSSAFAASYTLDRLSGAHIWRTAPSGTAGNAISFTERANIGLTEMVVNDPGNDYDFRVESDTNTHALFVDAGNSYVSINTSVGPRSPAKLNVPDGAQLSGRVISAIGDIYVGGAGRTFTITGGGNGESTYVSFTAMNPNGSITSNYFLRNSGGNWAESAPITSSVGTAPTVTVTGSGTATVTINVLGAGSNPSFFNGGRMNYEFQSIYVSIA